MPNLKARTPNPFAGLRNVGPATRKDFAVLRIDSLQALAESDPDELYRRLQIETGTSHDPCVWDVFAAAIHQAKTGEALNWWAFTPIRKARQLKGEFPASRG
ncbi:Mitomycin resistance protein mcrB [Asticcacaulis sp. AC460]|uniref:helix-hairpin-helix domain-containing protein n=1 Tax=Asticcacaulis sp. AC460 TaxID=1282360 RepID=UPI0003C400EE|nr:helix-hairpin-helix domain-containing protein [Asticcacaulis sp. AC460]ESQ86693.1 Mitomycin resistance protein mcrB [Asticcacaulis sp. AC460]